MNARRIYYYFSTRNIKLLKKTTDNLQINVIGVIMNTSVVFLVTWQNGCEF